MSAKAAQSPPLLAKYINLHSIYHKIYALLTYFFKRLDVFVSINEIKNEF